jgi:trans-aconitate methyltransferase
MDNAAQGTTQKPATAARMYDYYLGGIHNFAADQEAARKVIAQFPFMPVLAQANRAFLRRAVRHLVDAGVRQFLDLGSGIPTVGNVHEIAQEKAPDARVVYVDIDPVAVSESLEILDGNERATAVRADLRSPQAVLDHPGVRRLLDFDQPIGLVLAAVLHFVPEDSQAYDVVAQLVTALAPGSYLVVSHIAAESFMPTSDQMKTASDVYQRRTTTPVASRNRSEVQRFFAGVELLDPGVVWPHEWRPDQDAPAEFADNPQHSGGWVGVGRTK